jgi:hypothetical protein
LIIRIQPHSAELSDELEISRERVRQLQLKAVQVLKSGKFGIALRAAYSGELREAVPPMSLCTPTSRRRILTEGR